MFASVPIGAAERGKHTGMSEWPVIAGCKVAHGRHRDGSIRACAQSTQARLN